MMGRRSSRIGIQGVDVEMMIAEKHPLLTIPRNLRTAALSVQTAAGKALFRGLLFIVHAHLDILIVVAE